MLEAVLPERKSSKATVDWTNVRPVYRKMNDEFYLITEPFGVSIDDRLDADLGNLIAAIDVVDRTLDTIESVEDRDAFAAAIVSFLRHDLPLKLVPQFPAERYSVELCSRMETLREIIIRGDVRHRFADTIEDIFSRTESKRSSLTVDDMIDNLVTEWGLAGMLPVLVLGRNSNAAFERFFLLCCEMMPAVDMILDARSDYRDGQLSVRPSLRMYWKLFLVFALPLPKLFWRFPRPLNLVRYTLTFLNHVYVAPAWKWLLGR